MGKALKFVAIAAAIILTGGAAAMGLAAMGFYGAVGAVVSATNALALGAVLSGVSAALTKTPRLPTPKQDVEYSGTVESRRIVYGQMKVSGMNLIPPLVAGGKGQYLHQALVLAGHTCDSMTDVWFGDTKIDSADISSVAGTDDDGKVTSGNFANKAWIRRYLGVVDQDADYILKRDFPSYWDANHRLEQCASIFVTFKLDSKAYPGGKPDVTALLKGKRCYDPRLDSTNGGSGSQRYTDSSTWTWTSNPALCLRDYLTSPLGLGEINSRIDDALVIVAANICDEAVTIPPASPTTTQPRYTCNVVLNATDGFENNIEVLASAMLGHCIYSGGKWRMYPGAWPAASSFSLTDDDLAGPYSYQTETPNGQKYNFVRGTFIDPARNWQQVEFQPRRSATYETADGGERKALDTTFGCVTNEYEAERNGMLLLRQSRRGKPFAGIFNLSAFKIRPYDRGTLTIRHLGFNAQPVRCTSWKFMPDGKIDLELRPEGSSDWSDPLVTDYGSALTATDPGLVTYTPEEPSGLTATGVVNGVQLSWNAPTVFLPTDRYELYEYSSSTPFSSAALIWSGTATRVILAKGDVTVRYYWLLVRNSASNNTSDVMPSSAGPGVAGGAAAISNTLTATVSTSNISKTGTTSSLTTDSVTVTPNSGTSPYTYAWTRLSGSTSISANSASAATTTFTGTPLNPGDSVSAVFRCTVTDNVAATKTIDVNVTITRSAMSAVASPASLVKSGGGANQTTASTTVTPSGGTATYTYSWAKLSGDTFTINSPTSATTTFSRTGMAAGDYFIGVYRCTVTDSSSPAKTATVDVSVVIRNTNPN